jgi:hypothetical protein
MYDDGQIYNQCFANIFKGYGKEDPFWQQHSL